MSSPGHALRALSPAEATLSTKGWKARAAILQQTHIPSATCPLSA
jgi:hypothetical protein